MTIRILFLILLTFSFLVGCAASSKSAEIPAPSPTPEPIRVALSPVVGESRRYILRTCAWGLPSIVLLTEEASSLSLSTDVDLTLWWGDPNGHPTLRKPGVVAAPLGNESISIIVHQDNPIASLNSQDLQNIYTAQIRDWAELSSENARGEILVWAYSSDHPLRSVFDRIIIPQNGLTSHAQLVPSPTAMLEAIQENPGAIGYMPSTFAAQGAKIKIILLQPQPEGFRQPILGIATRELEGNLASLLHCLQNNFPTNNH